MGTAGDSGCGLRCGRSKGGGKPGIDGGCSKLPLSAARLAGIRWKGSLFMRSMRNSCGGRVKGLWCTSTGEMGVRSPGWGMRNMKGGAWDISMAIEVMGGGVLAGRGCAGIPLAEWCRELAVSKGPADPRSSFCLGVGEFSELSLFMPIGGLSFMSSLDDGLGLALEESGVLPPSRWCRSADRSRWWWWPPDDRSS